MKKLNKFFLSALVIDLFVGVGIYISRFRICPPINTFGTSSCLNLIYILLEIIFGLFILILFITLVHNLRWKLTENKIKKEGKEK